MAGDLTNQVHDVADVATAVARGDLSTRSRSPRVASKILELKKPSIRSSISSVVASEVTRVARGVRHRRQTWRPG